MVRTAAGWRSRRPEVVGGRCCSAGSGVPGSWSVHARSRLAPGGGDSAWRRSRRTGGETVHQHTVTGAVASRARVARRAATAWSENRLARCVRRYLGRGVGSGDALVAAVAANDWVAAAAYEARCGGSSTHTKPGPEGDRRECRHRLRHVDHGRVVHQVGVGLPSAVRAPSARRVDDDRARVQRAVGVAKANNLSDSTAQWCPRAARCCCWRTSEIRQRVQVSGVGLVHEVPARHGAGWRGQCRRACPARRHVVRWRARAGRRELRGLEPDSGTCLVEARRSRAGEVVVINPAPRT